MDQSGILILFTCIKHLAYVEANHICDDFQNIKELPYAKQLELYEESEKNMKNLKQLARKKQIIDLQGPEPNKKKRT